MSKSLVIVESPAKARTITKYLGRGYTVMASVGHVKDLPKSKLGVDLEHDFKPSYMTIKGKAQVLADIKKKADAADKVATVGSDWGTIVLLPQGSVPSQLTALMSNSLARCESLPRPTSVPLTEASSTLSAAPTCSTTRRPAHSGGTVTWRW